jgi:hypothetical protein
LPTWRFSHGRSAWIVFLLHGNLRKKKRNDPLTPSPNEKFRVFWPHISFATVP